MLKETVWSFVVSIVVGAPLEAIAQFFAPSRLIMILFAISNMVVGLGVLRGKSVLKHEVSKGLIVTLGLVFGFLVGVSIGLIGKDGVPFIMATLVLVGYDV